MIKRRVFILLGLFSLPSIFFAQNLTSKTIEIIYAKAYKNYKDTSIDEPRVMKDLEYKFICNRVESRFEYINTMSNDGTKTNERFIGRGGGRGVYYTNLAENKKLHQTVRNEKLYLVDMESKKYNWTLLKESKKILGYECFKAIAEYKYHSYFDNKDHTVTITAWYTPSIPLPFGPVEVGGLPGLVLEESASSFYFIAQKIEFSDVDKKIDRPNKGKEVTYEEFNDALYKNFKKMTGQ